MKFLDWIMSFFFKDDLEPRWTFWVTGCLWYLLVIAFWVMIVSVVVWAFFNFVV